MLVWAAVGVGALIVYATVRFDVEARKLSRDSLKENARELAAGVAHAVASQVITTDYAGLNVTLRGIMANSQIRDILLVDATGEILAHLERTRPRGPVGERFEPSRVNPPARVDSIEWISDELVVWNSVDADLKLGWLRFTVYGADTDSAILDEFRHDLILTVVLGLVTLLGVLGALMRNLQNEMEQREWSLLVSSITTEAQAGRDPLTGLANRKSLMTQLDASVTASQRDGDWLLVCFLDLDGFKPVNDRYGHAVGDELLRVVAHRLVHHVRGSDTVARLGGDEFVLLAGGIRSLDDCRELLTGLIHAVGHPVMIGESEVRVGVSVGCTVYPLDPGLPRDLLAHADEAMYQAKTLGRNRWIIYPPVEAQALTASHPSA